MLGPLCGNCLISGRFRIAAEKKFENFVDFLDRVRFLETQSKNVVDVDWNPSFWILLSEMGHSPENELMDFYGLFLYFAHAIFQEENGLETVDTKKLKSIKMIWLGVKKTNGKWLCKDPDQNLNGYEGIVLHYCWASAAEVHEPVGLSGPGRS